MIIVDDANGVSLQPSLCINCVAEAICAESETDDGTLSCDVLFYSYVVGSKAFKNCTCMIDVQSSVNVDCVSSVRVFKQELRYPGEAVKRTEITELQIGPK